ncbi:hypothetical protein NQ315_016819 [Exocentrus adspersus]|uniref:NADH dehydrogenase [ubiquinone] 1 beta subcomplex subunit 4 n=1 Tax=Exocentrus adspersus TaxID=1586481 RepID=A0AAV8VX36_9CUCU|nr:hypothetical protein NQ315_016819 [Exocentrus adspersus]
MSQQYDLPPEQQRLLLEKTKRRAELREQFLKLRTDPFRHASGEGGTVFDPALLRYQAMKVSAYDYFKPSGKNILHGLVLFVAPMVITGYFVYKDRSQKEASYRRGEVAYKDRLFKFI